MDGENKRSKSETLSLRLSPASRARLENLRRLGPYELSYTAILERGIELAARELEEIAARADGKTPHSGGTGPY